MPVPYTLRPMRIVPVPCLRDNYAYLVIAPSGDAVVVDPGEAAPVLAALAHEGARLTQVWATHHHPDHVGGIAGLLAAVPGLEVVAHRIDATRFAGVTRVLDDGDVVRFANTTATVVHNPGHTMGACSFLLGDALFTGDTLFGAGCGRLFEGDAPTMHASLQRLAALPPATQVYCGHEYTAANLRFAAEAWPDNPAIAARIAAVATARAAGLPSVPSSIADERATNPYLAAADATAFARLRTWKDGWRDPGA